MRTPPPYDESRQHELENDLTSHTPPRASAYYARKRMEEIILEGNLREAVLTILRDAIWAAHQTNPNGWKITLRHLPFIHFRLVVGIGSGMVIGDKDGYGYVFVKTDRDNITKDGIPIGFAEVAEQYPPVKESHLKWIREHATRRISDKDAHSSGVLAYLRWATGTEVPNPAYWTDNRTIAQEILDIETETDHEQFDISNLGEPRERILRAIIQRRGQRQFREKLLHAYEFRCAITGCDAVDALEAAHIMPLSYGTKTDDVTNGLLLRADIHTLFDLGFIAVDPATLVVRLSRELDGTDYAYLDGEPLRLPENADHAPNAEALSWHLNQSRER